MKTVTFILIAGIVIGASSMANARGNGGNGDGGADGDCHECASSSYFPEEQTRSTENKSRAEDRGLSKRDCEMVDLENGTGEKICLDGRL
ncbi:MAG: hypothetical protein MI743_15130 [Sneathiellales bacterium]|nr:hypothetical protein [Sneathiellales bacterium]